MTRSADISFEKAIEMTEGALSEVNRLAMEQIRRGVDISSNIEAAERDLRDALRQLVLAERVSATGQPAYDEPVRYLVTDPERNAADQAHAASDEP
jgi:hypothetical protein